MKLTFYDFLHIGRQLKEIGFDAYRRLIYYKGMKYAELILKGKKNLAL